MKLLDALTLKRRTAFDTVVGFARDETAGEATASDAETLEKALREANRTDSDYRELVETFRHINALQAEAKKVKSAEDAVVAARTSEATHEEETQRIQEQRKRELAELRQGTVRAQAEHKAAATAEAQLQVLELERPELVGGKEIDLDAYTLTWHGNIIRRAATDAPERAVSREVWERESRRRNEIHEAAKEQAHEEWHRDVQQWEASRQRNVLGELLPGKPPPEFVVPNWSTIVARNWNVTLDESEIAA